MTDDDLIAAIRERIADPELRVDSRPSEFFASVKSMSLGDLFSAARGAMSDVRRAASGDVDGELLGKANAYQEAMNRPAERPLPAPTSGAALERSEGRMGVALPALLRRLYAGVANGGFGPGTGLIGIEGGWTDENGRTLEHLYEMMSEGDPDEPSWSWPAGLVPIVDQSPVWQCVDTTSSEGRIVAFDHETIEYDGWDAAFTDVAPSLHAWLAEWVASRPPHEVLAEEMAAAMSPDSMVEEARRSREMIGRMSLEERRAMGLPDEGWERVVWGGLGWDEDEDEEGMPQ